MLSNTAYDPSTGASSVFLMLTTFSSTGLMQAEMLAAGRPRQKHTASLPRAGWAVQPEDKKQVLFEAQWAPNQLADDHAQAHIHI